MALVSVAHAPYGGSLHGLCGHYYIIWRKSEATKVTLRIGSRIEDTFPPLVHHIAEESWLKTAILTFW